MLNIFMIRMKLVLLAVILLFGTSACSSFSSLFSASSPEPSRIKIAAKEAAVQELVVSRADLNLALGNELKTTQIRAVEIFQNSSGISQTFPSFRLFDIQEGSVYSLLGLNNIDILVAINERAVVSAQVIGQVVRLLPNEKSVVFEVVRAGKSLLIKVRFV